MLSRHNQKVMLQKNAITKQRFALRKLTVGVASVLVGLTFAGYHTSVSANAQNANEDPVAPASDPKGETNSLNTKTLELGPSSNPKQLTSSEVVNEDSQPQRVDITNEKAAPINVEGKHKIRHWTEKKTITYIINVDGKQTYRHDYHFTKEHNTDEVTGDETGGVPVWEGDNIGWTQPQTYSKPGYDTYINGEKTTETVAYGINPDFPEFSKDSNVITDNVVYKALPQSIHIIYQDDEGKTVGSQEVSGVTDQPVDIVYKAPDGYFISDNNRLPKTYTFKGDSNQYIPVKVTKKTGQSGDSVTSDKDIANIVKFVDGDGNEVSHTVVSGKTGDKHNVKVPDGYHTKNQGHSVDVMIDEKTPEQIFTVIKDQSETGAPVTSDKNVLNVINYVDENGKTVKTDQVTGQDGDSITLSAPDGYHFVGQTPVLKINSSTPVQVVEVVADTPINNDTKPTKPIEQPSASDDEQKSAAGEVAVSTSPMASKGSSVVTTKTDNQSKQLPQTGDQSNVAFVGIGAASLLGMFGLAGLARKRNE